MAAKAFVGMTETKFYSEAGVLLSNPGNGPSAVTGTAYLLSPRLLESGDDCRAWHKRHLFHQAGGDRPAWPLPVDLGFVVGRPPPSRASAEGPLPAPRTFKTEPPQHLAQFLLMPSSTLPRGVSPTDLRGQPKTTQVQ